MAWNWWVLKIANLQSWTKSVKNSLHLHFLSHRTPIPQIWWCYGPSPLPTLLNVAQSRSEMIQPHLSIFFFGKGGVFVVASYSDFKSFILKQDMAKSVFLNIFVQDCSSLMGYSRKKNPHPHSERHIFLLLLPFPSPGIPKLPEALLPSGFPSTKNPPPLPIQNCLKLLDTCTIILI